jgi:hypothetical protein
MPPQMIKPVCLRLIQRMCMYMSRIKMMRETIRIRYLKAGLKQGKKYKSEVKPAESRIAIKNDLMTGLTVTITPSAKTETSSGYPEFFLLNMFFRFSIENEERGPGGQ